MQEENIWPYRPSERRHKTAKRYEPYKKLYEDQEVCPRENRI